MEERRRITTVRQLELLMDFMEKHQDLALGRVRSKEARANAARMWRELTITLNSEGPSRTSKEWPKVWNDYKCKVRAKLVAINANRQATGGGPSSAPELTRMEERVASIIGQDIGPLPNVRQDQFAVDDINSAASVEEVVEEVITAEVHPPPPDDSSPPIRIEFLEEPQPQELQAPVESPLVPSLRGHAMSPRTHAGSTTPRRLPTTPRRHHTRGRAVRGQGRGTTRQSLSLAPPAQSNRNALDESRRILLRIEELKAQTNLRYAESVCSFTQSFRLIAESIERFSREYARRQGAVPPENDEETDV